MRPLVLFLIAMPAAAAGLPAGAILDEVKCEADPSQTYALYLPSNYSPGRAWPVIFAFDPAARGRVPVERYRAAAEMCGYLVAGSNNSRNGSWEVSTRAVQAMTQDVGARFSIDPRRVYTAGMSGGARVALGIALAGRIAGVIASSAGFPDSKPRKTVPFPVFGTAGTEDFNLLEMRRLDRALVSPHRLAVFEGGHLWLSSDLAIEAVEWMEIQAARSGLPVDRDRLDRIYEKRVSALDALASDKDRYLALTALAADFDTLKDVSGFTARAALLARDKHVRDAFKKERDDETQEQREIQEIVDAERRLPDNRPAALGELRAAWKKLSVASNAPADSPDRRRARRVLRGLAMGAAERVSDPDYRKIVDEFRPSRDPLRLVR